MVCGTCILTTSQQNILGFFLVLFIIANTKLWWCSLSTEAIPNCKISKYSKKVPMQ